MAIELRGKPVADGINERISAKVEALKAEGVTPTLAIVRLGENPDDLSYERGATKRCEGVGIAVKSFVFDRDISHSDFMTEWRKICADESIHGILLFRPLPPQIIEAQVKGAFPPEKDVDCLLDYNLGRIFVDDKTVAPPCTAQAVMELLDFYDISVSGKNVAVVGRSLVVGKPLAMLLMQKNATVTICHSRTRDLRETCKNADIVIAAIGRAKMLDASYFSPFATVIDVGINVDENGNLCGDVDFEAVSEEAAFITPVPGGIGTVTTSVLAQNVVNAALK